MRHGLSQGFEARCGLHALSLVAALCVPGAAAGVAEPVSLMVTGLRERVEDSVVRLDVDLDALESDEPPQAWALGDGGLPIEPVPTELVRSSDTRGTLFWLMPGPTEPGQSRRFALRYGGDAIPTTPGVEGVRVERAGSRVTVHNGLIETVHDVSRGGTIVSIKAVTTGRTLALRMTDALMNDKTTWSLAEGAATQLRVLGAKEGAGSLGVVIEVETRFGAAGGDDAGPRAVYRYVYRANSPLVRVEVELPKQETRRVYEHVRLFTVALERGAPLAARSIDILPDGRGRLVPKQFQWAEGMGRHTAGALIPGKEDALAILTPLLGGFRIDEHGREVSARNVIGAWAGAPLRASATFWFGAREEAERFVALGEPPVVRASIPALSKRIETAVQAAEQAGGAAATAMRMLAKAAAQRMDQLSHLDAAEQLIAAAESLRDEARAAEGVVVVEAGPYVALANEQTGVLFRTDERAALVGLFRGGHAFVSPDTDAAALWQAELTDARGGGTVLADPVLGTTVTHHLERPDAGTARLVFHWPHVDAGTGSVRAEASITLHADDPLSNWRLKIRPNDTHLALWEVEYPIVRVSPDAASASADTLLIPLQSGTRLPNPTLAAAGSPSGGIYPGDWGWPFLAYWQGDCGLYFGAHDPTAATKRLRVLATGDRSVRLGLLLPVSNQGQPGNDFIMDYDCRIGTYEGQWYEATQVYRAWMVRQPWFPREPLHARADVPRWLKDTVVTMRRNAYWSPEDLMFGHTEKNSRGNPIYEDGVLEDHDLLGNPQTLFWWYHTWFTRNAEGEAVRGIHQGDPFAPFPPRFEETYKQLKERDNLRVLLYTICFWWDTAEQGQWDADAQQAAAVLSPGGNPYMSNKYGAEITMMCTSTPFYRHAMARAVDRLAGSVPGVMVDGIYFDLGGVGGVRFCYNPLHDHPLGSGAFRTEGMRRLLDAMRQAGRRHNPEFVLTVEGNADTYLDVSDGTVMFQRNTPVRQALYGDYQRSVGAKNDFWVSGPMEAILPAWNFVRGDPIGRLRGENLFKTPYGTREGVLAYYRNLVRHKQIAKPWLNLGRMLKPLTLTDLDPADPPGLLDAAMVPQATWQAPDGSVAFVFANARHSQPVSFSYAIDPAHYELASDGSLALCKLTPTTSDDPPQAHFEEVASIDGVLHRREALAAGDVLILVARPRSKHTP